MGPDDFIIHVEADASDAIRDFDKLKNEVKELGRTQEQVNKQAEAQARRTRQIEREAHQERLQDKRTEAQRQQQTARQELEDTRAQSRAEERAHEQRIAQLRLEEARIREKGRAADREISERRRKEQRYAREQRSNFTRLRGQQSGIAAGFGAWASPLGIAATLIGVDLVGALTNAGRQVFTLTAEFERLRMGIAAIEGSPIIADAQIRRLRQLADLPGVGFESSL